jgi:CheY-like chemotaxis protein
MNAPRILIVDDEPKVAFFFQKHLEMMEYAATAVNSGEAAIKELRQHSYDLMITDLRMPGMDGLELLRHVRTISPQTQTILVTAYGTDEVWHEAGQLQTFRFLSKPLKMPDLLASVREALSKTKTHNSGILALTGENFEVLAQQLESLRIDVGAQAAVLADTNGHVLVYAGSVETIDLSSMMALLGSTMAASSALAHQLRYTQPVHLSYFEGPPYDLYATPLNADFFLTLLHNRNKEGNRIGVVWLYTRRALEGIRALLGQSDNHPAQVDLQAGFAESVQTALDDLFGEPEVAPLPRPLPRLTPKTAELPRPQTTPSSSIKTKVEQYLTQFQQQTGLAIEHHLDVLDKPYPPMVTALLLKTLSVSLKNVYSHAQATIVGISFSRDESTVRGRIVDNGNGFDMRNPPPLHTLAALQKAYQQVGGQLQITAYPGQGTTLTIELPFTHQP